jgi:hypothetical protein
MYNSIDIKINFFFTFYLYSLLNIRLKNFFNTNELILSYILDNTQFHPDFKKMVLQALSIRYLKTIFVDASYNVKKDRMMFILSRAYSNCLKVLKFCFSIKLF